MNTKQLLASLETELDEFTRKIIIITTELENIEAQIDNAHLQAPAEAARLNEEYVSMEMQLIELNNQQEETIRKITEIELEEYFPSTNQVIQKETVPLTLPQNNNDEESVTKENRLKILARFDGFMANLDILLLTLSEPGTPIYNSGHQLKNDLLAFRTEFVEKNGTVSQFKENCRNALNTALNSELAKQPYWTEFLYNFLFVVLSVINICTLGAVSLISQLTTGSAQFFKIPKTEAACVIDQIQEAVNAFPGN